MRHEQFSDIGLNVKGFKEALEIRVKEWRKKLINKNTIIGIVFAIIMITVALLLIPPVFEAAEEGAKVMDRTSDMLLISNILGESPNSIDLTNKSIYLSFLGLLT